MNYNENYKLPSLTNSEQSIQNHFKQFSQPVRETWYQRDSSQEYKSSNQIDLNELPNFEMSSPDRQTNQNQFDHEFPPLECSFKQEKVSIQKWKSQESEENDKPKFEEYTYKQSDPKQSQTNFKQTLPQQLFQDESSQYFQMIEEPKPRQNFLYLNQQQITPQKNRQQPQIMQTRDFEAPKSSSHNKIDSRTPTKVQKPKEAQNNSKYIILETNVPVNKKKFVCQHPAPSYIVLDFSNKENPTCKSHSTMQVQLSLKDLIH